MALNTKTIRAHIDGLARQTGAPDSFVDQIRALFLDKGFSLEEEAAPYASAIEEAFRREAMIRRSTGRVRDNLCRLQDQFTRITEVYRAQLHQLRQIRNSLRLHGAREAPRDREAHETSPLIIATTRAAVVTPLQREAIPLVPGPTDTQ
jgi:hypothetical protein